MGFGDIPLILILVKFHINDVKVSLLRNVVLKSKTSDIYNSPSILLLVNHFRV